MTSFNAGMKAVVVGASGGIGAALVSELRRRDPSATLIGISRTRPTEQADIELWREAYIEDEGSIAAAATDIAASCEPIDLVLVATGVLQNGEGLSPEKSWRQLDPAMMRRAFEINAIGPALIAKHFLPLLAKDRKSVFAALSARVGSIGDNHLGGWYSYRASKAALNMLVRTLSVELARRNPAAICAALHPGTVRTELSAPFMSSGSKQAFAPQVAASHLLNVIDQLEASDSGGLFAWDGSRIPY